MKKKIKSPAGQGRANSSIFKSNRSIQSPLFAINQIKGEFKTPREILPSVKTWILERTAHYQTSIMKEVVW